MIFRTRSILLLTLRNFAGTHTNKDFVEESNKRDGNMLSKDARRVADHLCIDFEKDGIHLSSVNKWISKLIASATEKMMKQKDERSYAAFSSWFITVVICLSANASFL